MNTISCSLRQPVNSVRKTTMIIKNKNRIPAVILIASTVCALVFGLNVSKQTESAPEASDQVQAAETKQVKEPLVIYEAVFLDKSEINEIFRSIRGEEPPYELTPNEYHITVTFRSPVASYKLYGTKVTINGIAYKAGDVPNDEGGYSQNEGILVRLQSDNPEFNALIDSIQPKVWHITGSYSDKSIYTGSLDFSDAEPVSFSISGTFGAFMTDKSFRLTPEETAALGRPKPKETAGNTSSEITLYLWDNEIQDNRTYTDTSKETIEIFTELFDLLSAQTESSDDVLVLDESYESPQEGLIQNGSRLLTFLNQTVTYENETYHNAWFLEVISAENMQRKCFILPEGSRYSETVKLLLDDMHYQKLLDETDAGN